MRERSGIMLCYPFEEKRLLKWGFPVAVQPKLDGERCRAMPDGTLLSSTARSITSVPDIAEGWRTLQERIKKEYPNLPPVELDGELYVHGEAFEDISSVVSRTVNIHPLHGQMEYHVFDIVDTGLAQIDRFKVLLALSSLFPERIRMVPTLPAMSLDEIFRIKEGFVEDGYEGIIVRNIAAPYKRKRSTFVMKFKPKASDIYPIIGWKEEKAIDGTPKGRLGALVCTSDEGTMFSVGSGLSDDQRNVLWRIRGTLDQYDCKVEYQHSSYGVPRFPVFLELVKREKQTDFNPLLEIEG